jgi:NADPH:quinone reductase-like Zn-dependent oxidoreductase
MTDRMRAVVQDRYGAPEEALRIAEVDRPVPSDDQMLVEVHATTVTRGDAFRVTGEAYRFTRLITGLRRPRQPITGTEFAGRVVEVGATATGFRVGDEVIGAASATNAMFVAVKASGSIAGKPASLSFEEATAVPDGSLLAMTCLRPAFPLVNKRVLVYGAGGSIGTAAVQLLVHHFGATVTAVCDTDAVEVVRSLGAHEVLDRLRTDFTMTDTAYDVIFDAVGKHSFLRCRRSLKPHGVYVTVDLGYGYHVPFLALATRLGRGRRAALGIGRYRAEDLRTIVGLVEAGAYRPVIDRRYSFDEAVEAVRYVASGRKTGNVVLRVRD